MVASSIPLPYEFESNDNGFHTTKKVSLVG